MKDEDARLTIARSAARAFIDRGVAATSGKDIAEAAGVSVRTVWRHFRNKERCATPIVEIAIARFVRVMRQWPLDKSLEDHLRVVMPLGWETPQTIQDGVMAAKLIALAESEPDIRTVWLEAYHQLEHELLPIIAQRCNKSNEDFEVQLCAATMVAAIRVVDETVTIAAIGGGRSFSPEELAEIMGGAIRDAATMPICDPVIHEVFGARAPRSGTTGR